MKRRVLAGLTISLIFACLLLAGTAFVQVCTSVDTNTVSSNSVTFSTQNVTAGNMIFAFGRWGNNAGTFACSDTSSNSYSSVTNITSNGDELWYCYALNIAGGVKPTVTMTVTGGGTHRITMGALEYSGVATSSAVDQSNSSVNTGSSTTNCATGSITTTGSSDVVIAMCEVDSPVTSNFGTLSGYTNRDGNGVSGLAATQRVIGYDQVGVAAGTFNPTITFSPATTSAGAIVSFKPGSGVTPTCTQSIGLLGVGCK